MIFVNSEARSVMNTYATAYLKGFIYIFACAVSIVISESAASADGRRVALVIGNSHYKKIGELRNPRNDARAFAAVLRKARPGFTVLTGYDVNAAEFGRYIDEFGKELRGAEVGLFYFAGHSVQIGSASGGENYLLGIDAAPNAVREKELVRGNPERALKAARLSAVMLRMKPLVQTRLVFLDACRDNPLTRASSEQQPPVVQARAGSFADFSSRSSRSVARGLAPVRGASGSGGAYIAFATSPGEVALDGDGANSPFTAALIRHIATPGLDIDQAMTLVRRDVKKETAGMNSGRPQEPWSHSSLSSKFYFWPRLTEAEPATGSTWTEPQPVQSDSSSSSGWDAPSPSLGGGVGVGGF
jgi:uncharacterized caspase-like protein